VPLQPNYVVAKRRGELVLRNYQGNLFRYRNPKVPVELEPVPESLGDLSNSEAGLLVETRA
jgi:hypothetical protein